jgi:hypothetical protein
MFDAPKTTSYVAPAEPIDVMSRYLVKVADLVDQGVSKFAPVDKPYNRIRWVFRMAHLDGSPILDVDGNAYEHYDYTSSKTSKGKEGKVATARIWMEALLGPLEDSEIDGQITNRLKEKVAVALFEEREAGGEDGSEVTQRLRILKLAPYVKGSASVAKAERERAAAATKTRETVAAARSSQTAVADDDNDIPF